MWIQHKDNSWSKAKSEKLLKQAFQNKYSSTQITKGRMRGARQKALAGHYFALDPEFLAEDVDCAKVWAMAWDPVSEEYKEVGDVAKKAPRNMSGMDE